MKTARGFLRRFLVSTVCVPTNSASSLGSPASSSIEITFSQFSLDLLVRLAARAGLQPQLKLAA